MPPARMLQVLVVLAVGVVALQLRDAPAGAPAATQPSRLGADYALDTATAERTGARLLAQRKRAEGFRFQAQVAPYDRQAIQASVARARPEAQRLIGLVDGLTTVQVGPAGGAVGTTTSMAGSAAVVLDLGLAMRIGGQPALDRLVLHELGHVVDHMIVPADLRRALDADISPGYACPEPGLNACAEPAERFAETFAKWATGDVGVNLRMGYAAPPPRRSLEAWGRPLAQLGTGA